MFEQAKKCSQAHAGREGLAGLVSRDSAVVPPFQGVIFGGACFGLFSVFVGWIGRAGVLWTESTGINMVENGSVNLS